jgi:hypothetical protein
LLLPLLLFLLRGRRVGAAAATLQARFAPAAVFRGRVHAQRRRKVIVVVNANALSVVVIITEANQCRIVYAVIVGFFVRRRLVQDFEPSLRFEDLVRGFCIVPSSS